MKTTMSPEQTTEAHSFTATIVEMGRELLLARQANDTDRIEAAEQAIREHPLEVAVRSGWVGKCDDMIPMEYMILVGTGGPAYRLIGELDGALSVPTSVTPQFQDWGTPWMDVGYTTEDEEAMLAYASCFYYGE